METGRVHHVWATGTPTRSGAWGGGRPVGTASRESSRLGDVVRTKWALHCGRPAGSPSSCPCAP